jgi:hypothetical protein
VASLWALPFIVPLVISYHLKIVHANGAFMDDLFDPSRIPKRVIAAILPGLFALIGLGWSFWRSKQTGVGSSRATLAILAVWIILPVLFMARYFGCGGGGTSTVCTAFVVPVHHWMFYLQSALACVFGYAVMSAWEAAGMVGRRASGAAAVAGVAFVLACALLIFRPIDQQMRDRALDMRNRIDVPLYQWLLTHTPPSALFVADVSTDGVHDTASTAVLAAGRKSVALPFTFSNPYVNWETRRDRSEGYLAAALSGKDAASLCRLLAEAGPGNGVYIALALGTDAPPGQLQPVFRSNQNSVYSVAPSVCR